LPVYVHTQRRPVPQYLRSIPWAWINSLHEYDQAAVHSLIHCQQQSCTSVCLSLWTPPVVKALTVRVSPPSRCSTPDCCPCWQTQLPPAVSSACSAAQYIHINTDIVKNFIFVHFPPRFLLRDVMLSAGVCPSVRHTRVLYSNG